MKQHYRLSFTNTLPIEHQLEFKQKAKAGNGIIDIIYVQLHRNFELFVPFGHVLCHIPIVFWRSVRYAIYMIAEGLPVTLIGRSNGPQWCFFNTMTPKKTHCCVVVKIDVASRTFFTVIAQHLTSSALCMFSNGFAAVLLTGMIVCGLVTLTMVSLATTFSIVYCLSYDSDRLLGGSVYLTWLFWALCYFVFHFNQFQGFFKVWSDPIF